MGTPGGLNILLVEDHPDTAQALKRYLEFCGHSVVRAGTCEEALRHPDLARMEVLICDLGLPDGSGWELLPELRAKAGQAYAVAITARNLPGDETRSLRVGFQAHLTKPFAPRRSTNSSTGCFRGFPSGSRGSQRSALLVRSGN
jgi:two-component system OmpR family response regulator